MVINPPPRRSRLCGHHSEMWVKMWTEMWAGTPEMMLRFFGLALIAGDEVPR